MHLPDVENAFPPGPLGDELRRAAAAGAEYPQILHLFAFKPEQGVHLSRYAHAVMRGPSPLSPGQRELIAALTSAKNDCHF